MRFFIVFILILVVVHIPVYLLAKGIFRKVNNLQKRTQYSTALTAISFVISMAVLVYLFLIKPDIDQKLEQKISECKGYAGNISLTNLAGKWQVPWGFFTIDVNGKVTEKFIFNGKENTGSVALESNILTYLHEDINKDTVRKVYKICDYSSKKLRVQFIFTNSRDTIINKLNMEWMKVQE
ncbi:MAG: hypothetical protein ABIN89_16250 [Chitinophagaceae bacterium]